MKKIQTYRGILLESSHAKCFFSFLSFDNKFMGTLLQNELQAPIRISSRIVLHEWKMLIPPNLRYISNRTIIKIHLKLKSSVLCSNSSFILFAWEQNIL